MGDASIGFFHQFGVLLWKNWMIKKRHMWVTVFELLTPLVLFLILVGLRIKEPIIKRADSNFSPRPLPSSGMIAVLQEFCPSVDGSDVYGYPRHSNSSVGKFLDDVHVVWSNSSLIKNYQNVSAMMLRFNATWTKTTTASHNLDDYIHSQKSNGEDLYFYQLIKNTSEFRHYLKHHYNMSDQDASTILNSTVDLKSVLKSFTKFPFPPVQSRSKRSIPQYLNRKQIHNDILTPLIDVALYSYPGMLSKNLTKSEKIQQKSKLRAAEVLLFSPSGLRYMTCTSPDQILSSGSNTTSLKSVTATLCENQNSSDFQSLSDEFLSQINNTAVLDALLKISSNRSNSASRNYQSSLKSVLEDLNRIQRLMKYINLLVEVARIMPNHSCSAQFDDSQPNVAPTTSTSSYFAISNITDYGFFENSTSTSHETLVFNGTDSYTTAAPTSRRESLAKQKKAKFDSLAFWAVAQPMLCGGKKGSKAKYDSINSSTIHLTGAQKRNLGILFHVLTSNPKILYAPNNTQVDSVIQKANTSFAIIDNITKAVDLWMNVSRRIRSALDDSEVENTLAWLTELKETYREKPALMRNLMSGQPEMQQFLASNDTVPNRTDIEHKLDIIDNAGCYWKKLVSGVSINWYKGFRNEKEAVEYATEKAYHDNVTVFATLIFNVDKNGRLPSHVTYKIRQNASLTQDTKSIRLSFWRPDPFAWDMRYYTFGFVWLQDLIERSLIWEFVGHEVVSPGAYLHEMPYPCFRFDAFAMNLEHVMPLAMIISWVYTVAMFVQHIVYEKEQRLKEVMKIMGLSNGVHWLAWFVSIFLQLEITVTAISFLVKFGSSAILPNSNFLIIWLFFTVYAAATIMFCFLVSVLFSKAKVASACSGILYFISYLPFAYMSIQEYILHQSIPAVVKSAASLLSTTAFGLGAKYFAVYELSGYGIQWDNIAQTPIEGDTFSLWQAMYMLMIDICVYALLCWYIEAVFPGQYGLPRPWYFPLTLSYWMGRGETETEQFCFRRLWNAITKRGYLSLTEDDQAAAMDTQGDADIEPEPTHLQLGIRIEKLTKIYKKGGKKAINNLSLNFYENQITSFLGHNGAGKTTTMSILTGLFPPTSGSAYIYGHDIRSEMLDIRKSLGMCPQHNALFEVLTVEEHLWFYARLKGVSPEMIARNMDQFLDDVGLSFKRSCKVNTLSGGMKRKLSVAIAFVGGSRTVILDEPTAGVDPYARRAIWDLIIKYKEGRTILLSTHHMDEADLLGDRIAIISNGKLQCCGSSMFLKSTYGDGYNLTLLKKISNQSNEVAAASSKSSATSSHEEEKITKFVHRHVPSALVTSDSANQISFNLPVQAARKGCFHALFDNLPRNMEQLDVSGYGLTDTTLEEVFLKVDSTNRWESEDSNGSDKNGKSFLLEQKCDQKPSSLPSCSSMAAVDGPGSSNVELGVGRSQSHATGCSEAERANLSVPGCANAEDANIALEWLRTAPDSSNLSGDFGPLPEEDGVDEETLLMDYAFGDSSFYAPSSSLSKKLVTRSSNNPETIGQPCDITPDEDDVELLDIRENAENRKKSHLARCGQNLRILQGLLMKRFHYARRSRKAVFYQIMLPALFVCIAMTIALSLPTAGDPPPLVLSPSQYYNMTRPRGNFIPYSDQSVIFPVRPSKTSDANAARLISTFSLPSGVGATCVLKNTDSRFDFDFNTTFDAPQARTVKLVLKHFNPECGSCFTKGNPVSQFLPPVVSREYTNISAHHDKAAPCTCTKDGNTYTCQAGYGKIPVTRTVVTGDRLIDVTGEEPIMPYLKYTTNDFRLHRYGGFSFGEIRDTVKQSFPGWPSPLRKLAVRDAAQVFYNHKGFHAMPTYLNVFNNALLRANLPASNNAAAYGITLINHPMNKTAGALSVEFLVSGTDVIIAIFIIVAMSFVPASFLVFLVAEKQSRAKHLQFISGTGPVTYWISNYIWDMLNYMFPAILCITILQIFDLPAYTRGNNAYAVVALFLLYGWSMTPMMYPASFYFEVPSTAYVCMIVLNLFVGITTVVTTFMISVFHDDHKFQEINDKLQIAFLMFPNYNLGKGLMDLSYHEFMNDFYRKIGENEKIRDPFEWDLVTRQLVAMGIEGVVGFLVTLLFEVQFFTRFGTGSTPPDPLSVTSDDPEDVDVAEERRRVKNNRTQSREDLIIVDNISKVYRKNLRKTVAVEGLSFGVARGECFGLLGVNGAGKTTTFHNITGACEVTGGNIRVAGHTITGGRSHERLLAQQSTGYCPQFDSLFNELTPIEHLYLYSRLRGVPRKEEKQVVDWAISKLDLMRHKSKPVRELSGGNKRKLSVAIALVGDPDVVLLDEPTSGMDPAARRFLWDLVLDVTKSGRAVLLTSHSMEECEVLCSRIAIMVNGKFKCLGPTQHLKNRFGDGYMVSIRSPQPDLFVHAFQEKFPSAVLKEQHYHKAVFQLSISETSTSRVSLAEVFKTLEDGRQELNIEDYSVSQTTLDDVFINFAKKQGNLTEENAFSAMWRQKLTSWTANAFGGILSSLSRRPPHYSAIPVQNRENPNFSSDDIEDDLDSDTQPLYEFDQDMVSYFAEYMTRVTHTRCRRRKILREWPQQLRFRLESS